MRSTPSSFIASSCSAVSSFEKASFLLISILLTTPPTSFVVSPRMPAVAHLMFGQARLQVSHPSRTGGDQLFSEFVATFGLLCVIWGCARLRSEAVPIAVGLYITGAYWFTASTSFANPAVTLARAFTDTFAGIRPLDAPGFVVAQLLGAFAATVLFRWLVPSLPSEA